MTDEKTAEQKLAEHAARLQSSGSVPMTAEEILAGETQAGVPRPAFHRDHEDDGTVDTVDRQQGD